MNDHDRTIMLLLYYDGYTYINRIAKICIDEQEVRYELG